MNKEIVEKYSLNTPQLSADTEGYSYQRLMSGCGVEIGSVTEKIVRGEKIGLFFADGRHDRGSYYALGTIDFKSDFNDLAETFDKVCTAFVKDQVTGLKQSEIVLRAAVIEAARNRHERMNR